MFSGENGMEEGEAGLLILCLLCAVLNHNKFGMFRTHVCVYFSWK